MIIGLGPLKSTEGSASRIISIVPTRFIEPEALAEPRARNRLASQAH